MLIVTFFRTFNFIVYRSLPYCEVFWDYASRPHHHAERVAFNLRISLACRRFLSCEVIQGDLQGRTRLLRKGACLSAQRRNSFFPGFSHIIWVIIIIYDLPILMCYIAMKTGWIKVLKFSIGNCSMAPRGWINRKLTISINKAVIAYAYMRHSRTHNPIRTVSKNEIN